MLSVLVMSNCQSQVIHVLRWKPQCKGCCYGDGGGGGGHFLSLWQFCARFGGMV